MSVGNVGYTVNEATPEGRRVRDEVTVTIELTRKELLVAEHCGVLIEHPLRDRVIHFGYEHFETLSDVDEVRTVICSKFTRADLENRGYVVHTPNSEDEYRIVFTLADKNQNSEEA